MLDYIYIYIYLSQTFSMHCYWSSFTYLFRCFPNYCLHLFTSYLHLVVKFFVNTLTCFLSSIHLESESRIKTRSKKIDSLQKKLTIYSCLNEEFLRIKMKFIPHLFLVRRFYRFIPDLFYRINGLFFFAVIRGMQKLPEKDFIWVLSMNLQYTDACLYVLFLLSSPLYHSW